MIYEKVFFRFAKPVTSRWKRHRPESSRFVSMSSRSCFILIACEMTRNWCSCCAVSADSSQSNVRFANEASLLWLASIDCLVPGAGWPMVVASSGEAFSGPRSEPGNVKPRDEDGGAKKRRQNGIRDKHFPWIIFFTYLRLLIHISFIHSAAGHAAPPSPSIN